MRSLLTAASVSIWAATLGLPVRPCLRNLYIMHGDVRFPLNIAPDSVVPFHPTLIREVVAPYHTGGHASQSLWSWTPAAQLSLLRSAAKAPLSAPVHSLHPAAASNQPGALPITASPDGPPQLAAAATAHSQASAPAAEATAPRAGPSLVFADGSTALISLVGDELRLGPVAAAAGDVASDGQVRTS